MAWCLRDSVCMVIPARLSKISVAAPKTFVLALVTIVFFTNRSLKINNLTPGFNRFAYTNEQSNTPVETPIIYLYATDCCFNTRSSYKNA
jgi:hypothetical protein